MLKIFYGNDTMTSRAKLAKEVDWFENATLVRYDEMNVTKEALGDTLASQGLFGGKTVVVLDSVLEKEEVTEDILNLLFVMNESPNTFFLLAGLVDSGIKKVFERSKAALVSSDVSEKKKEDFSVFGLADAFGRRDRKAAWVLFTKAVMKDMSAQEICGTLAWQMRMVVLAHTTSTAKEAGVSDFPYRKAKSFTRHFSLQEAMQMLGKLVGIYHFDPEFNRGDTSSALERLVLSL